MSLTLWYQYCSVDSRLYSHHKVFVSWRYYLSGPSGLYIKYSVFATFHNLARFLWQWLEFWLWGHAVAWIQSSIFFSHVRRPRDFAVLILVMCVVRWGGVRIAKVLLLILVYSEILPCDDIQGSTSFLVDWLFFVGKGSYLSTAWIFGLQTGSFAATRLKQHVKQKPVVADLGCIDPLAFKWIESEHLQDM